MKYKKDFNENTYRDNLYGNTHEYSMIKSNTYNLQVI